MNSRAQQTLESYCVIVLFCGRLAVSQYNFLFIIIIIIIKYLFRSKTRHSKSQHKVWTHTRLQGIFRENIHAERCWETGWKTQLCRKTNQNPPQVMNPPAHIPTPPPWQTPIRTTAIDRTSSGHQQHNTTNHNTTQRNTTQRNTTQHNTTQHNATQRNTTQHNKPHHTTPHHTTPQKHHCTTTQRHTPQPTAPTTRARPLQVRPTQPPSSCDPQHAGNCRA